MRASTRWLAAAVLIGGALFGLRDRWVPEVVVEAALDLIRLARSVEPERR